MGNISAFDWKISNRLITLNCAEMILLFFASQLKRDNNEHSL
jgi:hypothetical protein